MLEKLWLWADWKFRELAEYCMRKSYHHRMKREHSQVDEINQTVFYE